MEGTEPFVLFEAFCAAACHVASCTCADLSTLSGFSKFGLACPRSSIVRDLRMQATSKYLQNIGYRRVFETSLVFGARTIEDFCLGYRQDTPLRVLSFEPNRFNRRHEFLLGVYARLHENILRMSTHGVLRNIEFFGDIGRIAPAR